MTSEGLGEMFEGDSADTCAGKFPLVSMGGQVEGLACADPGARTPIGTRGFFFKVSTFYKIFHFACIAILATICIINSGCQTYFYCNIDSTPNN